MNLKNIIKRPIITEKSIAQTALGKYTFAVDPSATKGQIREAVKNFFGVDVIGVQTIKVKGTLRKSGKRRVQTKQSDWKKAVVELKEGQKIEYFEVGGQK